MKFNAKEYKPKTGGSGDIPAAGSIVAVEIIGQLPEFDFSGTKERESSTGNPMIQVHARVLDDQDGSGTWMFDYIVTNSKWFAQKIGSVMDAVGFDMDKTYNITAKMLIGKTGYVRVKHEQYNGETRARIAYWVSRSSWASLGLEALSDVKDNEREEKESDSEESAADAFGGEKIPF